MRIQMDFKKTTPPPLGKLKGPDLPTILVYFPDPCNAAPLCPLLASMGKPRRRKRAGSQGYKAFAASALYVSGESFKVFDDYSDVGPEIGPEYCHDLDGELHVYTRYIHILKKAHNKNGRVLMANPLCHTSDASAFCFDQPLEIGMASTYRWASADGFPWEGN
jgi:hypothetical protein